VTGGEHHWHVPKRLKITALAISVASGGLGFVGALWKVTSDFEQARVRFNELPAAVDSLRDGVFVGRLPQRVARLEARTDSLSLLYGVIQELRRETAANRNDMTRLVCLVEAELGLRRAITCGDP